MSPLVITARDTRSLPARKGQASLRHATIRSIGFSAGNRYGGHCSGLQSAIASTNNVPPGPSAVIDDAQLAEILRRWPVARLATRDAAGNPHVVPVVFCLQEDAIYSPIDGKPKTSTRLKRLTNLEDSPSASLLIDHYDNDWQRLWWIRLDAMGDVVRPDAATTERLEETLRAKYPQYLSTPLFKAEPLFVRLRWHRVSAWAPDGFDEVLARLPETPPSNSG